MARRCVQLHYGMVLGTLSLFLLGSLSSNVFERRTSTGSGLFALMKRDFEQVFGQIVSVKVKTTNKTNLVASKHIKREKGSLPVNMRQSKTSLLKRSIGCYKDARETGSRPQRHGAIGHFRVPRTLTFKMRPSARPFLWKWVLFAREWKVTSISKAEHLTSFWYRGPEEVGNSLFEPIPTQSTSKRLIVKDVRHKSRYLIATYFRGS